MPDVRAGEVSEIVENVDAIRARYRAGEITRAETIAAIGRNGLSKPAICAALDAIDWEKGHA